jgi:hypothetical protein
VSILNPDTFVAANGEAFWVVAGTPVATDVVSDRVVRANAASAALSSVLGVVVVGADPTLGLIVKSEGILVLYTEQWDQVTGSSGGLVHGATYYLDAIPGKITTTPPSAPGTSITAIGRALSSTVLVLHIQPYIYQ